MTLHYWKQLTSAVLLTAACSTTSPAYAFLAGTKGPGMGFTGIAYPQDSFAGAYNPAGTMEAEDRFDLAATCIYNRGHVIIKSKQVPAEDNPENKFNPFDSAASFDPGFGINKRFHTSFCDFAVGVVGYNRERQKTSYSKRVPLLGSRSKLGMEYIHDVIAPVLSLRIADGHTVGVSFDFHLQRLSIKGLHQFRLNQFTVSPAHVTNNGNSYSRGFGATIGWSWKAMEGLTLGAVYRSRTKMSKFHKYQGFLAQRGAIDSPAQWGVGVAYQFLPCATVTVDIEWVEWDQIRALHNPLLHGGQIVKAGRDNGPGFGFNNQVFYRIGLDYAINPFWTVRMGFQNGNTVTKKSQTLLNMLFCRTSENVLTFGASYMWNPCNEFSFFYAHSFEKGVNGKNAIPTSWGSGLVNLTESKDYVGLSWGYLF